MGSGEIALKFSRASRVPRKAQVLLASVLISAGGWPAAVAAQQSETMPIRAGEIRGVVRDVAARPVNGAVVRLERKGEAQAMEVKSHADGTFAFPGVPAGDYVLQAELQSVRSRSIFIVVGGGQAQPVTLSLEGAGPSDPSQGMEFSDAPNFTIAAVTDWTAAGGHGSDSILRTSEALTREAVTLKPSGSAANPKDNASADSKEVEAELRARLAAAPKSMEATRALGKFYLDHGRYKEALVPLESAHRLDPADDASEYDLALALQGGGEFAQAREHVRKLLAEKPNANLLRLDGELDEKLGDPLEAVRKLEQAAREDPSEENYFQWGSELLLHRAIWQAKDVFSAGAKRYPHSVRMLSALGSALFACALYDEAATSLCRAADLDPSATEPYLFLGRIEMASPNPLACVKPKLEEFSKREPANALASFYLAMAMWKENGASPSTNVLQQVEDLLRNALSLDSKCSDASLQLGNLYMARRDNDAAIGYYQKAIATNPQLSEAHYRLGMALDRLGRREEARREFELHEQLEKEQAAVVERQRREIKQFLVVQDKPASTEKP